MLLKLQFTFDVGMDNESQCVDCLFIVSNGRRYLIHMCLSFGGSGITNMT